MSPRWQLEKAAEPCGWGAAPHTQDGTWLEERALEVGPVWEEGTHGSLFLLEAGAWSRGHTGRDQGFEAKENQVSEAPSAES